MRREVVVHRDPKSPISEVFRTLRTNIQFTTTSKKMKTLLITSTLPGEGKSWIASNLAVTFAQAGKKVVLIDADMRKGRQYTIFATSPRPGLSNYLSQVEIDENDNASEDVDDYIQETKVENLYLMPAGNVPPNPSELLVSPQMIQLLEELKESCDMIVIDGTPCELVTDSIILSRMVDATVIVTAHKITKKEGLQKVIKNIGNVGGKLAGVVVNKMPISGKAYEERYYYYGSDPNLRTKKKKKKQKRKEKEQLVEEMESINEPTETIQKPKFRETTKAQTITKKSEEEFENTEEELKTVKKKTTRTRKKAQDGEKVDRTNDILKQINQYMEEEKKKKK